MIAVALPTIADDFGMSVGRSSLLVTVYLAAMLVGQPVAGRVSDRIGTVRAIRAALVAFLVCSIGGAVAPSFGALVGARLGQAAAGAMLVPSIQALLRSTTPAERRGQVFGVLGSLLGVGAAAGPVIGGGLIQLFGWPAIFLVNVPVVLVALAIPLTSAATVPARASLAPGPWVNGVFAAGFGVQALTTLGQYLLLLLAPVLLESRGWSTAAVGAGLSSLTVGMIVMGPIGGRAGDRFGRRTPVVVGVGVATVALAVATLAGEGVGPAVLLAVLLLFGFGLGFAVPGNMTAALESVAESRAGSAAGILSMSRYVGSITSSVLVGLWIGDDGRGAGPALAVATVASALALVLAGRLPRRAPSR